MVDVQKYVGSILAAVSQRNGKLFALEIALPFVGGSRRLNRLHTSLVDSVKRSNVQQICNSRIADPNLAAIVINRLDALVAVFSNDYPAAYRALCQVYSASYDYFSNKSGEDTAWFALPIIRVSDDLRIVADLADKSLDDAENTMLRESITTLTRGWTLVLKDQTPVEEPQARKRALIALTNILFKIYFTLNSLSLANKLINFVEGQGSGYIMTKIHLLPVCDVVMYKYYYGRLMMFEDKYDDARKYLRMALRYCPQSNIKNRQRILASLVPVEMCLGILPSDRLGSVYGLTEMVQLAHAARHGDLRAFDRILAEHQISFIRVGVYLVLEQVRAIALRNLLKRVYAVIDTARINLPVVAQVLQWLGQDDNLDQVECLLANQIFQGKIKGYLSHEKRILVVSKANPFPSNAVVKKFSP